MSFTGTRGLRSPRNAAASASSSAWSQLPNALSVLTYPAMLTGASVAWSPTIHAAERRRRQSVDPLIRLERAPETGQDHPVPGRGLG